MAQVDWDPDNPPAEPPDGTDLLLWRLAWGLFNDHRPHSDGFCVTCREFWPCPPRGLAEQGFSAALRRRPDGPRPPDNSSRHY
jgi:hypothetical protein